MKVFLKTLLVFIFIILFENTFAAKILIESDSLDIAISESTSISVSVYDLRQIEEINLVGMTGNFKVVSVKRMNRMILRYGRASQIQTFKFYLLPLKKGKFKIYAKIYTPQKTYRSKSIFIKVRKNSSSVNSKGRDLFAEAIVSPKKAYLGQKISYLINFYTRYFPHRSPSFNEPFTLKNFIVKNVTERRIKQNSKKIAGKNYYHFKILKLLLIPTKIGKYEIPAKQFSITVQDGQAEGFFNIGQLRYLQTKKQNIEILPLPKVNKPKNFSGLVGEGKLEYEISNQQINFGEPVKIKVKITGNLNLENLDKLILKKPENFKIYENEINYIEDIKSGKYYSEKNFELVLVAEKSGRLEFPELKIDYFNTKTKTYDYLKVPSFEVVVKGSSFNYTESEDIIIKVKKPLNPQNFKDYIILKIKKSYLWISFIFLVALIIIFILLKYFKPFLPKKIQKSNLDHLWQNLKVNNSATYAYQFLETFFQEKFQLSLKSSSQDQIKQLMKNKQYPEATILSTIDCLRCIDLEKYGMKEENINYINMLESLYKNNY